MALRFGVIGTYDHLNLVCDEAAERDDVEFVGIAEPDQARGAPVAEKHGVRLFARKEDLLEEGLDAVGLFSPFHEKADDIADCIGRGIHVFADKPAATDRRGLAKLRAAVDAHPDVRFTMGLVCRVLPGYAGLRGLVKDGAVGKLAMVSSRRSYMIRRPTRPGFMFDSSLSGGEWVELAIHDVDYVRWLAESEYVSVSATHGNVLSPEEPFQDHGAGVFLLEGGVSAYLEHDRLVPDAGPGSGNAVRAVGSEGRVELAGGKLVLWTKSKEPHEVTDLPGGRSMFANFVEAIRTGAELIVPAEDVLRATDAALAAFESAQAGGRMVKIGG
jgi:myo-inositol 2-dehydrogenase/D-chiro-inositol 1-dehydrogenase